MLDSTIRPTKSAEKVLVQQAVGKSTFREVLLVLLLYLVLGGVLTFPFVLQLGSHVIDAGGDSYQNLWYMWWYQKAIFSGQDPARTHLMYGLLPSVQVLLSSVYNALWLIPFEAIFGSLFAFNLGIFASFPLAGLFTWLLAREFGASKLAAFVAGFCYTFSTYHFYRAEGHLGLVTIQWLPFYAWRLFVLRRQPTWANALLAALGLALCALSDLYYLGYFAIPFTVLFLLWLAIFERKTFLNRQNLLRFGVALGLGWLVILPFYLSFFQLDKDVAQAVQVRATESSDLSADLLAFFLPNPGNPLFSGLTGPVYQGFKALFPIEQAVYPGYVLLVAALVAPWLRRWRGSNQKAFWLLTAATAFVMALGPRLHIGGTDTGLPLPYALLYGKLPFLTNFRAPNRFAVMLALALCVLAALSFTTLFEYLQKRLTPPFRAKQGFVLPAAASAFLMVLYVLESIVFSWPLQTAEAKVPEIYRQIAAEPGDFLVMDLPLTPLSAPLYYQTIYQKPLVGGYPSRISNRMSLSFDKVPYLSMFNPAESSAVMDGSASRGQPDIFPVDISFKQALQQNNIRYVLLRNYQGGRRFFVWIKPFVETNLGAPIYQNEDASLLAWRVEPLTTALPAPAFDGYRVHIGDGWNAGLGKGEDGRLLRLAEQDAQLLIEAGSAGPANLHLKLTPYIRPQTIEVRLNGQVAGRIEGSKEWKAVEAALSNLPFKAGQNLLELHSVQGCLIATDYIPNSPDHRCISFAVQDVRIGN